MSQDPIRKILLRHHACPAAFPWAARHSTLDELWRACEAPDWMLWALDASGFRSDGQLRSFAASCAQRVQHLWNDPQGQRAVETARGVANGVLRASELASAYQATLAARAGIVERADYSEAMAAAAAAALSCVRDVATEAAMDASRESARAVWWDIDAPGSWPEEGIWQANELRAIVGADIEPHLENVRRRERGGLPLVWA